MTAEVEVPASVIEGLQRQLLLAGVAAPLLSVAPYGDGHSGFTYQVHLADSRRLILRLSPPGVRLAGPADVGRQARIMHAAGLRGLPVPAVICASSEPAIDGRAFMLTSFVDGTGWKSVADRSSDAAVAELAVQTLRQIQELPPAQSGIGDETPTRPEQELERWSTLLARGAPEYHAAGTALATALGKALPRPAQPVLVHGDFHYGNLIFADARVAAVVDWEIAQIGDPLVDLGCLAVASLRRRYRPDPNPTGDVDVELGHLIDLYGVDVDRAVWFVALSCLKYGAIIAFNLELHRSGKRPDELYERLQGTTKGLLSDGLAMLLDGFERVDSTSSGAAAHRGH